MLHALRADSADAPETHGEAVKLGLPLISTVNNYADFFTKTLKPGSFSSMRNKIMNIKTG